ncbi:ABC transporter permease [Clostridium sp. CF012]|uniref:ABC transporter permease n=1 Tax=Clostridium sp. CF012 TaxID=2843319 RepID=UPI001C0D2E6F|nr:ABC transporter permease [Clostridium sp. CF012]MBU3143706.1 ABC transporter permease [Clostridium sp. CF012]
MVRFVKRDEISKGKSVTIRIASVILALLVFSIVIILMSKNPIDVYASMIKGAFGSPYSIRETIKLAIPLCIAGLGIAVAFKMHFWNIGAEGQIIMGAFAASVFALKFPTMPKPILLLTMMVAGIIGGSLWALIPAVFKARWGTNETIVTLMMNYIAIKWIVFLQHGPLKDPNAMGFAKIANFSENAILPDVFQVHIGWIIAIVLVLFIFIFMNYTKKGYEISVLGESEKTALYSGVNIKRTIIISILLSGGLCGLVGMIQASGISNTLADNIGGGVGFTAIIVAWLGYLNAPVIMVVSILFAALQQGGSYIQTSYGIPGAAALILQAMILFFVLGSEFFIRFEIDKKVGVAK